MKICSWIIVTACLCIACCRACAEERPVALSSQLTANNPGFSLKNDSSEPQALPGFWVTEIPQELKAVMQKFSWRPGCPVPLEDLVHLSVLHWGYDDQIHQGELIVHRQLAGEILMIFKELLAATFPLEKIRLIDAYQGDDDLSMADNNSSAFNCRLSTGSRKKFSKHSYGLALDINPLVNPYVRKGTVLPPAGRSFLDREQAIKGMIRKGDPCHRAFIKRGWSWGGAWKNSKDYQHFEKNVQSIQ
ncbi:hypothetical protein CSB45_03930 [candidate division KSB3 bacterium]|uniref:Peptidase M15C domain-containing protein n=1 Tax=candidate division KSB3 bacterium TaxID=2044937 RepID=A0A2G6E803_9BACT|nr:MAG: hypothetical protein CSB45_03930 [candidate division KSB3 bacterium]PIE30530.1 MAG: hypothetical protein CSA57_02515 [candidate division KSB3 bacterium]